MRTTVTLDSDVEQLLRERMASRGLSFKEALNDAIRQGATGGADIAFSTPTFDLGVQVDLTKANRIAGDLEDADAIAQLRAGR